MPTDTQRIQTLFAKLGPNLPPIKSPWEHEPKERVEYNENGHLIALSLSQLKLKEIPLEVMQFHNLKRLYLDNNQISHIPPEIAQLTHLHTLSFHTNQISQIPPEIAQLIYLQFLYLATNQISHIPPEIAQLANLQVLYLATNQISHIPPEIAQLADLKGLYLHTNQINHIPSELAQLANLQWLYLDNNQISHIPSELAQLAQLQGLYLTRNQISHIPSELAQLSKLQKLYLDDNQISHIPSEIAQLSKLQIFSLDGNQISHIPPELAQLAQLQGLYLANNQISHIPSELAQLAQLKNLVLSDNQISHIPPQLAQLVNLNNLYLANNQISRIPPELGQLNQLQGFYLENNQISHIPPELSQLNQLQGLYLTNNQIDHIPSKLAQLAQLQWLNLENNQISHIPPELAQLTNLQHFSLNNNPQLRTPPPEIVAEGTEEILSFLRDLQAGGQTRYEAKVLLVGEGRAGKSCLLKALRGETFTHTESTHGIEVSPYHLPHPTQADTTLTLHTWDFGGQHIYHSTHQFFLTRRSLYLVVWNAGMDVEQAGLDKWLKNIHIIAPDAPIFLVATHSDQRQPDVNYNALQNRYPNLVGNFAVSNKNGAGIDKLQKSIAQTASELPLMGQEWPTTWLNAEAILQARPEHHLDLKNYVACCEQAGVKAHIARTTLGGYFHDLGKILYFQDDALLSNLVVLKPNWITKAISYVLTDKKVATAQGILAHADLSRLWQQSDGNDPQESRPYDPNLYPIFLRLMERFELSYQLPPDHGQQISHSLIPLLLPHEPPQNLPPWPLKPKQGEIQVEMKYRFDFTPPGLISRFIVRTHRYSTNQHWREGALLAYRDQQARIELNPIAREVRLMVWGIQPHSFFVILKETIEQILNQFPGLTIERQVPCICHWQGEADEAPCPDSYIYERLEKRRKAGRLKRECDRSYREVDVQTMLFGLHPSTEPQVIEQLKTMKTELKAGQAEILSQQEHFQAKFEQHAEWVARLFTRQWNLLMKQLSIACPNIFVLMPGNRKAFNPKKLLGQDYQLYLVCQHPPQPHLVGEGYEINLMGSGGKVLSKISPWLTHLLKYLKFAVPFGGVAGLAEEAMGDLEKGVAILEQLNEQLPTLDKLKEKDALAHLERGPHLGQPYELEGAALRALHHFLSEVDPAQDWGGLKDTPTPDGNILWLCPEHREPYEPKILVLPEGV